MKLMMDKSSEISHQILEKIQTQYPAHKTHSHFRSAIIYYQITISYHSPAIWLWESSSVAQVLLATHT